MTKRKAGFELLLERELIDVYQESCQEVLNHSTALLIEIILRRRYR